jgi:Holliday junction resolvasome RuvABC DNA-binding subunit
VKKAERLALELADRLDDIAVTASGGRGAGGTKLEEAVSALVALGYSNAEAAAAVRRAIDEQGGLAGIDLIRAALVSIKK